MEGQPLLILVKGLGNSVLGIAIVSGTISEMASGSTFNQSFIASYMNGVGAMCLNEILIVRSLEGQYGYIILFYAAISGKCYTK